RVNDELAFVVGVVRFFREHDFAVCSPLYEQIAVALEEDPEVLSILLGAPPRQRLPTLLLAAVRYLLLEGTEHPLARVYAERDATDPYPVFRDFCLTHLD